ncbi:MAG: hypothetical protein AB8B69_06685, partial [Chitinophagales bacterium]
ADHHSSETHQLSSYLERTSSSLLRDCKGITFLYSLQTFCHFNSKKFAHHIINKIQEFKLFQPILLA